METFDINIKDETYRIEQPISTINLYRIKHQRGLIEITRNRANGKWKILYKNIANIKLPLQPIGRAIEKNLNIID